MEPFEPALAVSLPPGWHATESLTLRAPDGAANVIVSAEAGTPGRSSRELADTHGEALHEFPGYRELALERVVVDSGDAYLRRFEWSPPDAAPVMQLQLYHTDGERDYVATGTTTTEETGRYELVLRHVLDSIKFVRASRR